MTIALVTPPLTQLNTPYPAVPMLTRFLRDQGLSVIQRDFSLDLTLRLFTPENVRLAATRVRPNAEEFFQFFKESVEDYARTVLHVIRFLQGKEPELAWKIATRNYLPEGPHFWQLGEDNEVLLDYFGPFGTADKAKFLASLYMDDLASCFRILDADFGFGKYAESLAVSLPTLAPLLKRLKQTTPIDEILDSLTEKLLEEHHPEFLGLSVPFPGTLYGAFRIAQTTRRLSPSTRIILGGGYVNSELRSVADKRVFDFFDAITYDDGPQPLLALLTRKTTPSSDKNARIRTREGGLAFPENLPNPSLLIPDYSDLNLDNYISIVETPNPMHRIWSDGTWLKLQVAKGCYWHKCAFCDLDLDYICNYRPAKASEIVDAMESLIRETGRTGFHFVDEAIPPALLRSISEEILRRNLNVTWWGNIRFEKSFTKELAFLMVAAGCIAVTGGLECANDRLLTLMNKGITLASASNAMRAFANAGILVHAYLMYAFPTETEAEAWGALDFVRQCFAKGILQSAYWHRFALAAHSPIAKDPAKYGIEILPLPPQKSPLFAQNELPFREKNAPNWDAIGTALQTATYNFMLGHALDKSIGFWKRTVHKD